MAYIRKTYDLYVVQQRLAGSGWEDVSQSDKRFEARADLKAYRENQPEYAARMITRREPKES